MLDSKSSTKRAENFMKRLKSGQDLDAAAMTVARQLIQEQADRSRNTAPLFKVGYKVCLY